MRFVDQREKKAIAAGFGFEWMGDRAVMVGTIAPSFNDNRWRTAYRGGLAGERTMSGVEVQAHMVSQLLGVALDGRPLLRVWPGWAEGLWLVGWLVFGRRDWGLVVSGAEVVACGCDGWRGDRCLFFGLGRFVAGGMGAYASVYIRGSWIYLHSCKKIIHSLIAAVA